MVDLFGIYGYFKDIVSIVVRPLPREPNADPAYETARRQPI